MYGKHLTSAVISFFNMSGPENYFDVHFDGLGLSIFCQNFEKTRFIKKETDGEVLAVSL